MTPAELFTQAGRALFGEEFVAPLANALGVERNTVGKWASGKTRIPPGVWLEVQARLIARHSELGGVLQRVFDRAPETFMGHPLPPAEPEVPAVIVADTGTRRRDS